MSTKVRSSRPPASPVILNLTPEQHTLVRQLGRLPGEGESPLEHLIKTYEALPPDKAFYQAALVFDLHARVLLPPLRRRALRALKETQ